MIESSMIYQCFLFWFHLPNWPLFSFFWSHFKGILWWGSDWLGAEKCGMPSSFCLGLLISMEEEEEEEAVKKNKKCEQASGKVPWRMEGKTVPGIRPTPPCHFQPSKHCEFGVFLAPWEKGDEFWEWEIGAFPGNEKHQPIGKKECGKISTKYW